MARKIVFTSGKGGVGKTTVTAGIGIFLSKAGERVLLFDADFSLNDLDVVTGVDKLVTYDVTDVLDGRCRARQALVRHPRYPNLFVLAGNHFTPDKYVSPQMVRAVVESVAPSFDFVLVDCPAGLDSGFHRAVFSADEAVVVTTPHLSALRDADKVISALKRYNLKSVQVLVNMSRGDRILNGTALTGEEIAEVLKTPLLAVIPEEEDAYLNDFLDRRRAFKMAAANLRAEKKKIYDPTKEFSGLSGWIKRRLR